MVLHRHTKCVEVKHLHLLNAWLNRGIWKPVRMYYWIPVLTYFPLRANEEPKMFLDWNHALFHTPIFCLDVSNWVKKKEIWHQWELSQSFSIPYYLMFNVKITQLSFAFLFSSSSSAASSLLKSWSSTLDLTTYIPQHCSDNVAAERQGKSTCNPSMVCMCPSGKDIETNRLWGQLEFLSPSWKCLPDPVVSVTGPLLASSPIWWMATFPFFIALLNHALTMLLWPIFAALFDFPPIFEWNSKGGGCIFFLSYSSARHINLWRFIIAAVFRWRFEM